MSAKNSDSARPIFFYFDRDADGKLTSDEFFEALLAAGGQITYELECIFSALLSRKEFLADILPEFGSTPSFIEFINALNKSRQSDETFDQLKQKLLPFQRQDGTILVETLQYMATFSHNPGDRIDSNELDELIRLVDPLGTGTISINDLCGKLIPQQP